MRAAQATAAECAILGAWSGDALAAATDGVAIGRTLLSLVLVVGLILGLGLLLRGRTALRGQVRGRFLSVKAQLAVGVRERVVLLRVGDEDILVGVSPAGLRTLHVLPHALPEDAAAADDDGGFAKRLAAMLGSGERR